MVSLVDQLTNPQDRQMPNSVARALSSFKFAWTGLLLRLRGLQFGDEGISSAKWRAAAYAFKPGRSKILSFFLNTCE